LSQFVQKPTIHHHCVVQDVLRYIKVAPAQGFFYSKNYVLHLKAFSDSDWASCSMTRLSTIGFYNFLGDSLILWKSKKQSTVSIILRDRISCLGFNLMWVTMVDLFSKRSPCHHLQNCMSLVWLWSSQTYFS